MIGALDMFADKGEWDKCLQMAEQQNYQVLHKYVALYATHLIKASNSQAAMELYTKYGTPAQPQVRIWMFCSYLCCRCLVFVN